MITCCRKTIESIKRERRGTRGHRIGKSVKNKRIIDVSGIFEI